ncbi:hypothetical protein [Alteromonas lipotrueae]|uniref:hypothetical protein n=1 Tax=Alteromonas lipotrueae TaxID=2803814 RepID=UPI001C48136C|nr:hypothetical protein [Alteromonas lipotrueae]
MKQVTKFLTTPAGQIAVVAVVALVAVEYGQKKASKAANAVNPLNNDNVFASGVDGVGASVTGDSNFKLGSWIYDLIHGETMP